tara:strand:+ start:369 stop:752 length:384 start_codon:yes stop_codon:yes gene_type:complete
MISCLQTNDPKCDYFIVKNDAETDRVIDFELSRVVGQEYTDLEKVDYRVNAIIGEEPKLPLSFSRLQTVEDAIVWYSSHHPELNDDIIEMISKSQFGNLPIKNARQKGLSIDTKFGVEVKQTTINFD